MAKVKKEKKPIEKIAADGNSGLARALASSEFHTRENGLKSMTVWLAKKNNLSEDDVMRLWKAIFFCFWHSDSVPVQAALAERLSEIMFQLPEHVGELYFKTFILTMRREWFGIDHLRLDKFMMLVRKFFSAHLRYLQATKWDAEKLEEYSEFWLNQVLTPSDKLITAGFAFHVCDLLLPQLQEVLGPASGKSKNKGWNNAAMRALLAPYATALEVTKDKALVNRLRQGVFEPLVQAISDGDESVVYSVLDVDALATNLFDLGAKKETRAGNREVLYSLSKVLELAVKKQSKAKEQKSTESHLQGNGHAAAALPAEANGHASTTPSLTPSAAKTKTPSEDGGSKKKKKRKASETETPVAAAAPATEPSNGAAAVAATSTPSPATAEDLSEKKKKKKKKTPKAGEGHLQGTPQWTNGGGQGTPNSNSHQQKQQPQSQRHSTASPQEPPNAAAAAAAERSASARKKSVRFSMKNNLVMKIGGPVPHPDTRTPPRAKPKGPALKKSSLGPGSAPGRLQKSHVGGTGRKTRSMGLSPRDQPRARAAEFF